MVSLKNCRNKTIYFNVKIQEGKVILEIKPRPTNKRDEQKVFWLIPEETVSINEKGDVEYD